MKNIDTIEIKFGTDKLKKGFAKMQKGGVIMDVTNAEQAIIAEESGAVAVMALERVPADIRAHGGVARMADPKIIQEIIDAVSIPVMAKARIGHFVEAQALEALGVDMIDESEVLTPADPFYHIDKRKFTIPFVCGCRNLGEAVRRIWEGAAMIRTKGEAGTGNIIEAIRHQRMVTTMIKKVEQMNDNELHKLAEEYSQSYVKSTEILTCRKVGDNVPVFEEYTYATVKEGIYKILLDIKNVFHRLPVVNFAAGGIATPADAAIMMQLGSDGVFVGSGIFKSDNPSKRAKAIVEAVANYDKPDVIAEVSKNLGEAMTGIEIETIPKEQLLQERGW
ncbi:MAG: pyridoxal 5'-phosphate synthase lyase subunit PdxS [Thermoplasmata archaeon]|nr:MAG: pyridoxal 5'-phosphate synthase lyase subunit PdxS [Thermoplasmata archaeon]RLF32873.1 MAG: pyridoxal 5'-phosphate synthase lyase subunit PdxS [Thermoplasmata archaeon]RLF52702.1 MAG: pyridoxal 5'-phosphate synthase lyase subunit PdxS [Thermoplasmata archaeon]